MDIHELIDAGLGDRAVVHGVDTGFLRRCDFGRRTLVSLQNTAR